MLVDSSSPEHSGSAYRGVERRQAGHADQSPLAILTQLPALVVLRRIPVAVLAIGDDGAIVFANSAFVAMLGHTLQGLQSLKFPQIFRTLQADEASAVSVVRSHANQLVELVHADGSTVWARMSTSALLRGDDPFALATFQDVTEQLWASQT